MNESHKRDTEQKKPSTKEHIVCDFINGQHQSTDSEVRSVVISEEE